MLHGKWGFVRKETGNEEEREMKRGQNSRQTRLGERRSRRQQSGGTGRRERTRLRMLNERKDQKNKPH